MVGRKKESVYRKKRKRKGFSGVQKQSKRDTETTEIVSPTTSTSHDCSDSESEVEGSIGASRKKMKLQSSPKESCSEPPKDQKDVFQGQGYRLVDLERFSSTLSEAHVCEEGVKISYVHFSCACNVTRKRICNLCFLLVQYNLFCLVI